MKSETATTRGRRSLPALVASLALLALPFAGCGEDDSAESEGGGGGGAAKQSVKVNVASFKFLPKDVKVKAGGTLTWTNQDVAPHTASSDEEAAAEFDTERITTGKSKESTFEKPGNYPYFCRFHPFMTGTVAVSE